MSARAKKPKQPTPPKQIPTFKTEDEERRFWSMNDAADFFDWGKAVKPSFPALKPTTESISLRLPISMLEELKALANKRDVPYQSLMKIYLADQIRRERRRKAS
jgi:predicted DNA binding CopG/RHH family protein